MNDIFQQYKMGVLEMRNGHVVQQQVVELDFTMDDYYSIPLEPDDRVYNRARVKEETRRKIERYYEGER